MRTDPEALARVADTLQRSMLVDAVCQSVEVYRTRTAVTFQQSAAQYADADARFIGAMEGLWAAFCQSVIRAAGGTGTPDSILAMDSQARAVANEAYRKAYAEAVAGQVGGGA